MTQLVEVRESGLPPRQVVINGTVEVGRDCDGVLLSDPETSRRHAAFTSVEDFLTVRDLGSTNGTTVNGNEINAETLLNPGDVIGVGDVRIVTIGPVGADGSAPATPPEAAPGPSFEDPPDVGPVSPPAHDVGPVAPVSGVARVSPPPAHGSASVPGSGHAAGSASVPGYGPGIAPVSGSASVPGVAPVSGTAQVPGIAQPPNVAPGGTRVFPPVAPVSGAAPPGIAPVSGPAAGRAVVSGPPQAYAGGPPPARPPAQVPAHVPAVPGNRLPAGPGGPPLPIRPALEELTAKEIDAAVLRYRPGSAGEAAATSYATAVRRARKRLAGLGSEPWGVKPQICLVDPFPDPDDPTMVLTSGTVVDAARGEIWVVVTAESPPEPPERPLALFFGAALPAARELELLIEGYGLHLCGVPSADPYLAEIDEERGLPPLVRAEGELRTLMALSFVRYLIERSNEADVWKIFTTARPGSTDQVVQDIYGLGLPGLEEQWLQSLEFDEKPIRLTAFLRLCGRYLRPYLRREFEIGFYLLLQLAFAAIFPQAFSNLIDSLRNGTATVRSVGTIVGLLAGVFAVSLVAEVRRTYVSAFVSASIVRQLRTQMFSGLQQLSARWYSNRKQGDVLSRLLSDVGQLEAGLSNTARDGLFQLASLIVAAVNLIWLNWIIGLIILAGAPVVGLIYRRMDGPVLKRSKAVQENVGALVSVAAESYQAHPVVQAFGLEGEERNRFKRASDRLFKRQLSLTLFSGIFDLSVDVVVTTLRLVVLFLGAYLVIKGNLSLGDFAAAITLITGVVGPVTALTTIGQLIQTSTGALSRVNEILGAKPDVDDYPNAQPLPLLRREIRVADVSFSYDGDRQTLRGVNVTIPVGSKVAFVGPTGAGKSSLLQLIMRFYDPDRGGVLWDGQDIRGGTIGSLRAQLGVVFQETFLFDGTLRDNIGLGRLGASAEDIEKAAKQAQLHEYIITLPRGYDTPVGERGVRLSGGQRQRLALARALLRDPAVLLLDEATSALDPRTERLVAQTLDEVSSGRTLIAVTHRLTSVVDYDRIYVLEDGQVVEQGGHQELVALGGVYADLWAEQNGLPRPAEAPAEEFDPARALAQVPFFFGLDRNGMDLAIRALREVRLERGDVLPARSGRMAIVVRGQGQVYAPDLGGRLVPVAKLGPGQIFGLGALLGDDTAAQLHAERRLELLVLTEEALYHLAGELPSVAAALGARRAGSAPLGGDRLTSLHLFPKGLIKN